MGQVFDYRVPKVPKNLFKWMSKSIGIIASRGVQEICVDSTFQKLVLCLSAMVKVFFYEFLNLRRNSQHIHNKLWKVLDLKKYHHQNMPNHPHYHHFLRWDWMRYVDFLWCFCIMIVSLGFFANASTILYNFCIWW